MQITGGWVEYARTHKIEDFNMVSASMRLYFSMEKDAHALLTALWEAVRNNVRTVILAETQGTQPDFSKFVFPFPVSRDDESMRVSKVSVEKKRTLDLGNYSNVKVAAGFFADLELGDVLAEQEAVLCAMIDANLRAQLERFTPALTNQAQEYYLGLPVEAPLNIIDDLQAAEVDVQEMTAAALEHVKFAGHPMPEWDTGFVEVLAEQLAIGVLSEEISAEALADEELRTEWILAKTERVIAEYTIPPDPAKVESSIGAAMGMLAMEDVEESLLVGLRVQIAQELRDTLTYQLTEHGDPADTNSELSKFLGETIKQVIEQGG